MNAARIPKKDQVRCPTCEGGGRVVSLRYGRERRRACPTCDGRGALDAGVWPFEPWPATYRQEKRA